MSRRCHLIGRKRRCSPHHPGDRPPGIQCLADLHPKTPCPSSGYASRVSITTMTRNHCPAGHAHVVHPKHICFIALHFWDSYRLCVSLNFVLSFCFSLFCFFCYFTDNSLYLSLLTSPPHLSLPTSSLHLPKWTLSPKPYRTIGVP